MSSRDRLSTAIEAGIVPKDSVTAALGTLGASAAEALASADTPTTPDRATLLAELDEAFSNTHQIARDLYEQQGVNLVVPSMDAFTAAGYDTETLAITYNEMRSRGLEPELVLAPMLRKWQMKEFMKVSLNNPSTLPHLEAPGIDFAQYTKDHLDELVVQRNVHQPTVLESSVEWTMSIMPGLQNPIFLGESYEALTHKTNLPSISQLIALHLQRLQASRPMVDCNRWSFARRIPNDHSAPAVCWNSLTNTIFVSAFTEERSGRPDMGARPVVGFDLKEPT